VVQVYLQIRYPSDHPTDSVKALTGKGKINSTVNSTSNYERRW